MALPNDNYDGFDDLADKYVADIQAEQVGITPPNFADADTTTLSDGYAFNDIDLDGDVDSSDALAVLKHISNLNVIDAADGNIYNHFLEVLSYYDPESVDGTLSKTANHGPCMSLRRIRDEYNSGSGGPVSFSDFVRGGSYVTDQTANNAIPTTTTNTISFDDYYGTKKARTVTYELIGGGGEGAGGYYGTGNGNAGGTTTLASSSGTSFTTVYSLGGAGGTQPAPFNGSYRVGEAGEASYYGSGGNGGYNSNSNNQSAGFPAPSTSYGAGGGGGGAYPFSANNGGGGGKAADRETGTLELDPGSVLTITIGAGGTGNAGGGDGAGGYVKLTVNGTDTEFTSSGTFTVPS